MKIASPEQFIGCSDAEIVKLEVCFKVSLPESYKLFLKSMGKRSGKFSNDSFIHYNRLFTFRKMLFYRMDLECYENKFPQNTFIFEVWSGDVYHFFYCKPYYDDPMIYTWKDCEIKREHRSFSYWLKNRLEEITSFYDQD